MTQTRHGNRWMAAAALLAVAMLGAGLARPATGQNAADDARQQQAAAHLLADQFVMMMSEALAGQQRPRPDQLRRARVLLDQAIALQDDDAELWRLRIELAEEMDDRPAYREAVQKYVRLQPEDDAAQLELFLDRLRDVQTLDRRLDRLEAILQTGAVQQLSRALRSRLASQAAAAAHELGRDDRFAHWLREAARLDPANPEAARQAYLLAVQSDATPVARGTALVNMVKAAPGDAMARLRLADWLTDEAVYATAAQQYDAAVTMAGTPLPPTAYPGWVVSLAAAGDAGAARQLLDELVPLDDRARDSRSRRAVPVDPQRGPGVWLELQLLRLATLDRDDPRAGQVFDGIAALVAEAGDEQDEAGEAGEADGSQPPATRQGRLMLAWVAAVFEQRLDEVEGWLADHDADDPLVRRARGWLHVHRGESTEAAAQLEPIVQSDPLAMLAVVRLSDAEGSQRTEALQRVVRRDAAGLAGMLAAQALQADRRDVKRTSAGGSVAAYMDRAPMHLWRPALTVAPWVMPHLRVTPGRLSYLEPMYATVEVRNTSRMSLPIGSGVGVPDRALLTATPSLGGRPSAGASVWVNLDRRLSLEAGETMRVTVRLDRSALGALLAHDPTRTVTVDVRAVLGAAPGDGGRLAVEPLGGAVTVRAVTSHGEPMDADRLDAWLAALDA
ncbi:MAG: hypothetical protein WD118_02565, partial [Phycisphaeraceae bacterium]